MQNHYALKKLASFILKKSILIRFKALALAYAAGREGGTMPTAMNAANEIAVSLFMQGKIPFLKIEEIVERVMDNHQTISVPNLEAIMEIDSLARKMVYAMVE